MKRIDEVEFFPIRLQKNWHASNYSRGRFREINSEVIDSGIYNPWKPFHNTFTLADAGYFFWPEANAVLKSYLSLLIGSPPRVVFMSSNRSTILMLLVSERDGFYSGCRAVSSLRGGRKGCQNLGEVSPLGFPDAVGGVDSSNFQLFFFLFVELVDELPGIFSRL